MRSRNTLLAALECFRNKTPDLWVNNIVTFLYVCENEGISINELAHVSRLSLPTASRAIRSFAVNDRRGGLGLGLVELVENPADARSKLILLTEKGRQMALELDRLISLATPIQLAPDRQ